jgi:alpha-glucosidase
MKTLQTLLPAVLLIITVSCTKRYTVNSPDRSNRITIELDDRGSLFYTIESHGTLAVEKSHLGVLLAGTGMSFDSGLTFSDSRKRKIDETYTLPTGKTSTYSNRAYETIFTFLNPGRKAISLVCRAFNDGVAFRYVVEQPGEITVEGENTVIVLPTGCLTWMSDYLSYYENDYPERLLDTIGARNLSFPALAHVKDQIWMLMTEASVYDQPGTHLKKSGPGSKLNIGLPEASFTVQNRWESPWRTFIMGTGLGTLVESVMVENLNPPSAITNTNWIEPGVAVFPWWGNFMANSYPDTLKRYIDLAAEMNWEWIEFDVSLVGSPFHSSKLWETTPWLADITQYAQSRGIRVYGWDEINTLATPEGRDHILGRYQELGIRGIKIDYLNSDRQKEMIARRIAIQAAADRKLMVSFHGETVPRGQRRTYPNVMTLEAVRGAEYYALKGYPPPTPGHNCVLPFTRNVVGSMDYTPVTFTIRPENPRQTTYAHELALGVIFESGWLTLADRPEAYLNSPAKDMLRQLEAAWDETRFIDGYPGQFVCLARRKAGRWYIAGINAGPERTVNIPLTFIGDGDRAIHIYEDKPGHEMNDIQIRNDSVNNQLTLSVKMAPNGGFCSVTDPAPDTMEISIHADQVSYQMAGGIGASWHAISEDSIDEGPEYKWALRYGNSRGSAWGGNPPVTDTSAWNQIYRHASWLGLSFLRVELSARMYHPERDRFDWDNEEMAALYKILDWAESNGADVFLQQMWSNVKWNSYPGVQPLLSAPKSVDDFSNGIASLLEHLTVTKKYTCIKWICITNEPPGGGWGSWWSTGETDAPLAPALKAVREALDRKKILVPISGPDWTDLPAFDPAKIDFDPYIGAYDIHSYQGIDQAKEKIVGDWVAWARKHGKPMFLTEIGDMRLGWKDSNPGPKSFAAALSNAESILRGLNAGAGAFNRWSFTNRGDLDGQWQLIRTWDIKNKRYLDEIEVEPAAFYGYGIITRFCAKHSWVVKTDPVKNPEVLSQTLKSPDGMLTTYILNKSNATQRVSINLSGVAKKKFYLYIATEQEVAKPGFKLKPVSEMVIKDGKNMILELPGNSINALTNYNSLPDNPARK